MSNVNVAVAGALHPGLAQWRRTTRRYCAYATLFRASLTRCRDARRDDWVVRVPASSANLGPGFDAVALALDVHLEVTADRRRSRARNASRGARVSPEAAASDRSRSGPAFPAGAGSGSRARRASAGSSPRAPQRERSLRESRAAILRAAGELEGHFDNVAASLYGGVVAVAGGRAVRIPLPRDLAVVVWTPDRETATPSARRLLPDQVPFEDAAVQRRPHRAAGRGARRRRRRRAADRDRGPAAPGPAPRPGPRHPPRDRGRARGRRVCRRGCRDRVRRPPRSSNPRARTRSRPRSRPGPDPRARDRRCRRNRDDREADSGGSEERR